ncbi:MAG TPA: hypothetical protein VFL29_13535 [Candidatus Dormibacteraeota bacterium]|nr:hypothetical protein [Candidatus Dormibacteraeota bacterium]
MVWLQSILLYVHILGAIFWFGSGMMLRFIFVPSLSTMPYEAQHPWLLVLRDNYSKIIGPVGGLTVLFGILRGISTGVLGILNTPYGITFVTAFVLAIPVIVVGARFVGPTAEKLAAAGSREEVLVLARQISRYGWFETGGMLLILVLMVAMHAGY